MDLAGSMHTAAGQTQTSCRRHSEAIQTRHAVTRCKDPWTASPPLDQASAAVARAPTDEDQMSMDVPPSLSQAPDHRRRLGMCVVECVPGAGRRWRSARATWPLTE